MIKKLILMLLVAVLAMPVMGIAADADGYAVYDTSACKLAINGSATGDTNILIVKDLTDFSVIGDSNPPFYTRIHTLNGDFSETIDFENNLTTGVYNIYVGEAAEIFDTFTYVNIPNAEDFITNSVNTAADEAALKTVLLNAEAQLGIKADEISANADYVAAELFKGIPYGTAKAFYEKYNALYAIVKIKTSSAADTLSYMKKFAAELGFDYENDYVPLADKVKTKLCEFLTARDYSGKTFMEVFNLEVLVAKCACAEQSTALRDVIEKESTMLGIDLTGAYSTITDKSRVYADLMNYRSQIVDVESLRWQFNNVVSLLSGNGSGLNGGTPLLPGTGLTGNNGSSLGGNGGGGGMSYESSVTTEENEPYKDKFEGAAPVFNDVPDGHWAKDYVEALYAAKLISGAGNNQFLPDNSISRAEVSKMIANMLELKAENAEFSDVSADSWYASFVGACAKAGIVNGTGDGVFSPEAKITRQDCAVMLMRAIEYKKLTLEGSTSFSDSESIADYALEAVSVMAANGLINGYSDGSFKPAAEITRAEAAALICRIIELIK